MCVPEGTVVTRYQRGGKNSLGWVTIWLVDEHGCQLHTEPVCAVNEYYFPWFLKWLEGSRCQVEMAPLLHHEFARDGTPIILK